MNICGCMLTVTLKGEVVENNETLFETGNIMDYMQNHCCEQWNYHFYLLWHIGHFRCDPYYIDIFITNHKYKTPQTTKTVGVPYYLSAVRG